jgi:exodeoxyribonuclease VII large subunit
VTGVGADPARHGADFREVPEERRVLTVSDVNRAVRALLEGELPSVWVAGEVSNLRRPGSGHVYLTLKDDRAQLRAVMWRGVASRVRFPLTDGLEVICRGRLTLYEARGDYQLAIDHMEPRGLGAAQLALEALKRKLHAEGLFDESRKRPLPRFPFTVALVTSATSAAVKDMLEVIDRRWPKVRVLLCPVRVQGEGAAREVEAALRRVSTHGEADVVIVGRGGGSREDLWAFNDEGVARAIAASVPPVVSSVGHAIDTTVADLVADRRALTPTEAAELATPLLTETLAGLEASRDRLGKALLRTVVGWRERLDGIERSYAFRDPAERVRRHAGQLDDMEERLSRALGGRLERVRERLAHAAGRLDGLSPLRVLTRGYSVTTREGGDRALVRAEDVRPGERIRTRLPSGTIISEVIETCPDRETTATS